MQENSTMPKKKVNIEEVVDKLLSFDKLGVFEPLSEFQLPFLDGGLSLQLWAPYPDLWGVVMNLNSTPVGYKEFVGLTDVFPRMSTQGFHAGFPTSFDGYESHLSFIISRLMHDEPTTQALYVKETIRDCYSGIGKAIISTSLEIMKRLLRKENKFRDNYPMFMALECSKAAKNMLYKYYQARPASNYDTRSQDIVVFTDVVCPEIEIAVRMDN